MSSVILLLHILLLIKKFSNHIFENVSRNIILPINAIAHMQEITAGTANGPQSKDIALSLPEGESRQHPNIELLYR